MKATCSCCKGEMEQKGSSDTGEFVCYCSKVTEDEIKFFILEKGAKTVEQVLHLTGAMQNSNCKEKNPKGICCYPDIVAVFEKYIDAKNALMNLNG